MVRREMAISMQQKLSMLAIVCSSALERWRQIDHCEIQANLNYTVRC